MENSLDESESQQSFQCPPMRRRSTFFERRDSIVAQTESENIKPMEDSVVNERHTEDMTRYYQKLLAEKEMWKKEVNERRNNYRDLKEQYEMAAKSSSKSRISYSVLTKEDIEFLNAKPNLTKLIDSQQKLHKSVLETMELYRRVSELDDVILKHSENVVDKATNHILENSNIEEVHTENTSELVE